MNHAVILVMPEPIAEWQFDVNVWRTQHERVAKLLLARHDARAHWIQGGIAFGLFSAVGIAAAALAEKGIVAVGGIVLGAIVAIVAGVIPAKRAEAKAQQARSDPMQIRFFPDRVHVGVDTFEVAGDPLRIDDAECMDDGRAVRLWLIYYEGGRGASPPSWEVVTLPVAQGHEAKAREAVMVLNESAADHRDKRVLYLRWPEESREDHLARAAR